MVGFADNLRMRGVVATAYIAIDSGSPRVVPSCDKMVSPFMNSSESDLYVLVMTVASGGHRCFTFLRATI